MDGAGGPGVQARSQFRRWGAVWILTACFLTSWGAQALLQVPSEGWAAWWQSTLENWQSEFLQLVVQAFLLEAWASRVFRAKDEG